MACFETPTVCSCFGSNLAPNQIKERAYSARNPVVAYNGKTMRVVAPSSPLARGSLGIESLNPKPNYTDWNKDQHSEAFDLMQRVADYWQKKGISDYLIYGKDSNDSSSSFNWEIIPYPKEGGNIRKQFNVLWNIAFGPPPSPFYERQNIARDFQAHRSALIQKEQEQNSAVKELVRANDAFCQEKVIHSQLVFEGKEINVLYNYAPLALGEGKLHFLLVTKEHKKNFSELSKSEYLEAMELTEKLIKFYRSHNQQTAYIFDKSGPLAGQSVPHWHEHIVFTATKSEEFLGKLRVLKNMLLGYSRLSKSELQSRVESLRSELQDVLANGVFVHLEQPYQVQPR